jgi:hypothetical protein
VVKAKTIDRISSSPSSHFLQHSLPCLLGLKINILETPQVVQSFFVTFAVSSSPDEGQATAAAQLVTARGKAEPALVSLVAGAASQAHQ